MMMNKIGLYVRVSTQEQATNGYSLDEQIDRLTKFCDAMNWENTKVYKDAGFSGGNLNRPALQELIKDIPHINKVVVYKLDRLSRSQKDTLYLIEDVFLKNGVDFVSMSENFDTSSSFGRAMIGILSVFAQLEREQIKERMTMGKYARAKQGNYNSSKSPIGYDYIDGQLVTNAYEKALIQRMFTEYSAGKSPKKIAECFNSEGLYHKYGKWQSSTVRSLLTSKIYLGLTHYHDDWYQGTHEAFISEDLYNSVQRIINRKTEEHLKYNRRFGKANSFLGGFLYCGKCGAKYSKITYKSNNTFYPYYVCNSRSKKTPHLVKDGSCRNKNWRMAELDGIIFNEIRKLSIEPESVPQVEIPVEAELKRINDQIKRLMDLYSVDGIPLDTLTDKIHSLNEQRLKLEQRPDKLSKAESIQIAESFDDVFSRGDFEEIRSTIGMLINRIELDGEDITIYWNF